MNELIDLATKILDHACPNYVDGTGWNHYYIETHCVAWRVTARKRDGQWEIDAISGEGC
jgi:hypothetical protein